MSKQGQYNYKGINAQAWAAMSLFLQYLRNTDFSYIQLEAPKFEDFNLVFNDGHKIICESKNWGEEFNFSHLKEILKNILRKTTIGEKDEILIICTGLNVDLESKVEHMKYWSQITETEFKKKKFSDQQITILDKVKFWKVKVEDNHLIVYSLFSELLDFWLPEDELECKANSILVDKIYKGSEKGDIYKREDIISKIGSIRKNAIKYSGHFDNERVKIEKQLKVLTKAINNNKATEWASYPLSAISAKPALMFFILDRLSSRKINRLKNWDKLWSLCYKTNRFSFSLFKIFENNLHTKENKEYILKFFGKNIGKIRSFYQYDFLDVDVVKIIKKILKSNENNEFTEGIFKIINKLIKERRDDIFYLEVQQDDSWERGEVSKFLKDIYEKARPELKGKIYKLIINSFNLIEDDGEFSHYTPREIFEILGNWLESDFEKRLPMLTKVLSDQYNQFYKKFGKKLEFNGWEYMGGASAFWEHDYKVSDRHFIFFTLEPSLKRYYKESKNKVNAWNFIKNYCISLTENVGKYQPDFLNRAIIPIVLCRYTSNNKKVSEEAFGILKEFILSKKGIPHKSELIYQKIRSDFPDNKKWQLVKTSIDNDKHRLPVSPFVQQITLELAEKGTNEAKDIIKDWLKTPEYYERDRIFKRYISVIISGFLNFSFNEGLEIFKDFIRQKHFIKEFDSYDVSEIASLLNKIINKNLEAGIEILNELAQKQKLRKNEKILLFRSLTGKGDSTQENKEIIINIYNRFLDPFLNNLDDDIKKIEAKINLSQSREEIVDFASVLAKYKYIPEAIRIVKVFINDSNPCTPEKIDLDNPEGGYDEHKRIEQGENTPVITTVRGKCAWVLMECTILEGRDYIEEIIRLTEKLTLDKNYHVMLMSCYTLSQLARNRLTVMPDSKGVLFFHNNIEKALTMAKKVERIAFNLLGNFLQLKPKPRGVLMSSLMRVFDHIRVLNQNDAMKLLKGISECGDEIVCEAAPLFIYFAESRQKDFKKWEWQLPGLYDDLEYFDNKPFRYILKNILKKGISEINYKFAWQFNELVRMSVKNKVNKKSVFKYNKAFKISIKYLNVLSNSYDHQTFKNIYHFIKENMDEKFLECYKLWRKCLDIERPVIERLIKEGKISGVYWWPFYYNDEILIIVKNKGGNEKFLDSSEFLLDYPREVDIGNISNVIEILQNLPSEYNKKIEKIFDKLINRNPVYYNSKEAWKKKVKNMTKQ